MKKLHIISVCPNDLYFATETRVQLFQMRKFDYSKLCRILVFVPHDRIHLPKLKEWEQLEKDFPETKFFYYLDVDNFIFQFRAFGYVPLLRPHTLIKHWEEYPELEKDAIFYIDSDAFFTKEFPFTEEIINNDVCYLSSTISYTGAEYFISKQRTAIPEKQASLDSIDVLNVIAEYAGINKEIVLANDSSSGGAQSILKNVTKELWQDVFQSSMMIKVYLANINHKYFKSENLGFQSWVADMVALQWNLWKRGVKTESPSWMDFSWASDPIDKWDKNYIFHNAGATGDTPHLFNKRKTEYINNEKTPFEDDLSFVSPEYCSFKYVQAILDAKPN